MFNLVKCSELFGYKIISFSCIRLKLHVSAHAFLSLSDDILLTNYLISVG